MVNGKFELGMTGIIHNVFRISFQGDWTTNKKNEKLLEKN